ncbi:MAG: hypothetical protein K2N07_11430, partial [Desulfovibrio sp.]|nr:hypothetical protein [Desulfovibrio sp.]
MPAPAFSPRFGARCRRALALLLPVLLPLLLLIPRPALAAFTSANDGVAVESAWNPAPAKDDIVLPMPCGLSLTLRAVAVPAGGLIKDRTF